MKLFDLHCDTLYETYHRQCSLANNSDCHISLDRANTYDHYSQIFAVWSNHRKTDDENYSDFFKILEYNKENLRETERFTPYLAVEGGKLLAGDISRLDALYGAGVRFLTLVWNDICCMGGAHDNEEGLSDFGKAVVRRCFEIGIVPDLSHSSQNGMRDALEIARETGKPLIATHSNSYAVCPHSRNLTDELFLEIAATGGIVGISLCRAHLTQNEINCTVENVADHILHYLSLGDEAKHTVCLGCDFDGISNPPEGVGDISQMENLANELTRRGVEAPIIENIFHKNAQSFIEGAGMRGAQTF